MTSTHQAGSSSNQPPVLAQQTFAAAWDRHCKSIHAAGRGSSHTVLRGADERDHHVARKIMDWLGTDEGMDFLALAESMMGNLRDKRDAYAAAWGATNYAGTDGWRLIERLLIDSHFRGEPIRPILSPRDHEMADLLITWLGTGEGQNFLARCDALMASAAPIPN